MATLSDIRVSAFVNILRAFIFLLAFALLRIQPLNDSVYFPKWYLKGQRTSPDRAASSGYVSKFVIFYSWAYFTFLNWMHQALRMSENDLIHHAGLDSAAFPKIYILGKYEDKSHMRWSSTCSSSKSPRKNIRELPLSIGVCLSLGGGTYVDDYDPWSSTAWKEDSTNEAHTRPFISSLGEAVIVALEILITRLAKSYDLRKDALYTPGQKPLTSPIKFSPGI